MKTEHSPLVSVIVPAYNSAAFIDECLESVRMQTYRPLEVIAVDDGSSDGTWGKILSFRDRTREGNEGNGFTVHCLKQENGGVSRARNAAIRIAAGKYLSMLDSDDLWPEEKLELQVRFLQERPSLAMTFGDARFFLGCDEVVTPSVFRKYGHLGRVLDNPDGITGLFTKLLLNDLILTGTEMIRRECVISVGCFDESLSQAEDTHLWLKLAALFPFGFIDHVLLYRRLHAGNASKNYLASSSDSVRAIESIRRLHPELAQEYREHFERKLRDIYFARGYYHFTEMRLREAREAFLESLRHQVTRSALIYLASTFLPPSAIRRIRIIRDDMRQNERSTI